MISAIPTYVALTDFGLGGAAALDMTRRFARGDREGTLRVFQSAWVLISVGLLVVAIVGIAAFVAISKVHSISVSPQAWTAWIAALILVGYAICVVQMTIVHTGFRSTGHYALGTALMDLASPIETLALILIALLGGGLVEAAAGMTAVRCVSLGFYYLTMQRVEHWLQFGWQHASISHARELIKPSLAQASLTLSFALNMQGLVLAVGTFISPASAGIFGAARTLTRAPTMLSSLGMRAISPELTAAYAQSNRPLFRRLMKVNMAIATVISVPSTLGVILLGPWLLARMSHGQLIGSQELFIGLALAMISQSAWGVFGQALFASNQQHQFTHYYIPISIAIASSPYLVGAPDRLWVVSLACGLGELVMVVIVGKLFRQSSKMAFSQGGVSK